MTTLRDVAERAGVSAMTVSNVVNGRLGKVSAATLARVRAAIAELGYVPNAQARALAGASSRIVALVYGMNGAPAPLTVTHESEFTAACEAACRDLGLALMLCAAVEGEEPALLARLTAWNVEGVIILGSVPPSTRGVLGGLERPVVLIDPPEPGSPSGSVTVGVDDAGGGRLAGEHLWRAGHQRVVYACPNQVTCRVDEDRLAGLRAGLAGPARPDPAHSGLAERETSLADLAGTGPAQSIPAGEDLAAPGVPAEMAASPAGRDASHTSARAGSPAAGRPASHLAGAQVRVVRSYLSFAAGVELGDSLAAQMPGKGETAVFASADILAMGIVAGLRRAGVAVPEQVSVVGFDGFEVSTYCDPVLTTVVQPLAGKAQQAVEMVWRMSRGERTPAQVVLPVTWREGGTLAPVAGTSAQPSH